MKHCPKCGTENKEEDNFCKKCGTTLEPGERFCPKCGTENPENTVFCVGCGEKLEAYPEPEEETQAFITKEIEKPEIKTMKCLYCDEENTEDTVFCIGCGKKLGEKVKEMVVKPGRIEKEEFKIRCTKCSTLNRPEAEYCNACGKSLIFEYASVLERFAAVFIDGIIINIGSFILSYALAEVGLIISILASVTYFIVLEGPLNKGQTIGKMAVSIRVVKDVDRSMITYQDSLIRNILRLFDMYPYLIIPYLVGVIAILDSEKKQRLGDRAAKTIVIKE